MAVQLSAIVSHQQDVFDPRTWSRIPPELLVKVISRLPVPIICRFRSVAKDLNQVLSELHFAKLHAEVAPSPGFLSFKAPWTFNNSKEIGYIEGSGKRRSIPLSYMPAGFTLRASRGGLLLFTVKHCSERLIADESIVVCNPITREWKKLKTLAVRDICHLDVDVNKSTGDYKVVVAGWRCTDGTYWQVEVYDSRKDSWDEVLLGQDYEKDGFTHLRGLALLDGVLYLLVESAMSSLRVEIITLEGKASREVMDGLGVWWAIDVLGKYQDDLIIVGRRSRGRAIDVWLRKKENEQYRWLVLDRLNTENVGVSLFVRIAFAGGLICVSFERDKLQALYDLKERTWRSVDLPANEKYWAGLLILPFEPSFAPVNQPRCNVSL